MPELFNYSPPIMVKAGVGPDPDGLSGLFLALLFLCDFISQSDVLAVMLYFLINVCFRRHTHLNGSSLTSTRGSPGSAGLRCLSFQR